MYLQMLEKAIMLLQKYSITEFPIRIDVIDEITFKEGIKLQITKYLKKAFYYEDSKEKIIYLGHKVKATYQQREYILHETAHMYHCGNTALLPHLVVDKNESQAEDFEREFLLRQSRSPNMTFEMLVDLYYEDSTHRVRWSN
ncbi:protein of unknown function [Tepidanaerobacter acetatoxydans Re1]|uniref:IrrE N-terminal-like domain-containing protein n=1 Tax=Tepidanaerobacter acetatoxydans (strain DSM 21804 / JCM 16047 / Re1) TaxID=1209989 RepID=L0S0I8_TEPAE|nr:hypothetical protein [Tepidanaerobacter acetatoxydans]CCP26651.1 protein of unknown function [Tepidanaerobacter acetatoxydans Re1]